MLVVFNFLLNDVVYQQDSRKPSGEHISVIAMKVTSEQIIYFSKRNVLLYVGNVKHLNGWVATFAYSNFALSIFAKSRKEMETSRPEW
jgi:hypothetical protein